MSTTSKTKTEVEEDKAQGESPLASHESSVVISSPKDSSKSRLLREELVAAIPKNSDIVTKISGFGLTIEGDLPNLIERIPASVIRGIFGGLYVLSEPIQWMLNQNLSTEGKYTPDDSLQHYKYPQMLRVIQEGLNHDPGVKRRESELVNIISIMIHQTKHMEVEKEFGLVGHENSSPSLKQLAKAFESLWIILEVLMARERIYEGMHNGEENSSIQEVRKIISHLVIIYSLCINTIIARRVLRGRDKDFVVEQIMRKRLFRSNIKVGLTAELHGNDLISVSLTEEKTLMFTYDELMMFTLPDLDFVENLVNRESFNQFVSNIGVMSQELNHPIKPETLGTVYLKLANQFDREMGSISIWRDVKKAGDNVSRLGEIASACCFVTKRMITSRYTGTSGFSNASIAVLEAWMGVDAKLIWMVRSPMRTFASFEEMALKFEDAYGKSEKKSEKDEGDERLGPLKKLMEAMLDG